jgi:hypothetical protein
VARKYFASSADAQSDERFDTWKCANTIVDNAASAGGDRQREIETIKHAAQLAQAGHGSDCRCRLVFSCQTPTRRRIAKGGRANEAEAVYRVDLRRHPANGWALAGLIAALQAQQKHSRRAVFQKG